MDTKPVEMPSLENSIRRDRDHLIGQVARLRAALNAIVLREPELDCLPLDQAFRTLREVTKIAREAL